MKIKIQNFLFGKSHSWSVVTQNLGRELIKQGHQVDLISTDGIVDKFTPNDLKKYIKDTPDENYEACLSYTAMHNFPVYLKQSSKNRLGIWCYEFPILPTGFAKYHQFCDYLLPPSKWAAEIFINNKIPEVKVKVVPHGITLSEFELAEPYVLKTQKSLKFLLPLGQPHLRKGIDLTIEAFYKAFKKEDDVVLVAKVPLKKKGDNGYNNFDVNVNQIISELNRKYPNHPEIELITEFVPNMASLYKACDVVYSLTRAECFFIPGLECFASNKLLIVPRHGGQLEFCSDENCLLVDGKLEQAPVAAQYWSSSVYNTWFTAAVDDAVAKLRHVYNNYQSIMFEKQSAIKDTVVKYSWENVTKDLMKLL